MLLTAAAAATTRSLQLHWLPCRGAMLDGFVQAPEREINFSDACLQRMDTGLPFPYPAEPAEQLPWATELGVLAIVLAALAWLVVVPAMRWSSRSVAVALLPVAASLVVAAQGLLAARAPERSEGAFISAWLWLTPEVLAVLGVVLLCRWQPELRGIVLVRVVVLLQAATAFGMVRGAFDYLTMTIISSANWDVPPGTGFGIAVGLFASALATAALTWPRPEETA